ncbi:MAG: hypothetical protein M5R42_02455 [Rhodocyclaceae bacterium]|nr:hypothetical protein [Rhodocyclaceae bacterium]
MLTAYMPLLQGTAGAGTLRRADKSVPLSAFSACQASVARLAGKPGL